MSVHSPSTVVRPLRVCLVMHSTRSDNLGVGALTIAQVDIVRRLAAQHGRPAQITIVDSPAARAPYVTGDDIRIVDLGSRFLLKPSGFFALARASDVVIDIAAGDSFTDIYSRRRLQMLFAMKFLTHLARRPLVMAPQTIGPFHKGLSKRLAALTMRLSRVVATRDALSTEAARALGVRRKLVEASDVALRLPYDPPPPRAPEAPVRFGLNVSGLLMSNGYRGQNDFGLKSDYPAMIRQLLTRLRTDHPDCEIHLVPHVIVDQPGAVEDDYQASLSLAQEFDGVIVAPPFPDPVAAKTYIAGLDFFAGARMHACIAAFSSGVPVVPMAYSRKFAGLFGSIGYDETVDCTSEPGDQIVDKILTAFANREALAERASEALARGLAKLDAYEATLGAVFEDA